MIYTTIIKTNEDGVCIAYIPELDCYGDGKTPEEAKEDVRAVAEDLIAIEEEDRVRRKLDVCLDID